MNITDYELKIIVIAIIVALLIVFFFLFCKKKYDNYLLCRLEEYEEMLQKLTIQYERDLRERTAKYEYTIEKNKKEYLTFLEKQNKKYKSELQNLTIKYKNNLKTLETDYNDVLKNLEENHDDILKSLEEDYKISIQKSLNEYSPSLSLILDRITFTDDLLSSKKAISPSNFFSIYKGTADFTGIYILHNKDNDKYYVGQSKKVINRVNQHFTGHGNGDVYADYKYGNKFEIKLLSLSESKYDSLDALEKDYILKYDAKNNGYNGTNGNS